MVFLDEFEREWPYETRREQESARGNENENQGVLEERDQANTREQDEGNEGKYNIIQPILMNRI